MSGIDGMEGLVPDDICNICSCEFKIEEEGGMKGYIGILPFSLCPMCYSGIVDMVEKTTLDDSENDD